jgi:hypothetical protein
MPAASLQTCRERGYVQHRRRKRLQINILRLHSCSMMTHSGRLRAFAACSQEEETRRIPKNEEPIQKQSDDPFSTMNEYTDSIFGKALIAYFTHKISQEVGVF